jgi:predicted CXXCH cytochrome family protein
MSGRKTFLTTCALLGVLLILACGLLYHFITTGGLTARGRPSSVESRVAGELLSLSIPKQAKALKNSLTGGPDSADVAAGRALYQQHCEVCHGFDGKGQTATSGGLYPRPTDLSRSAVAAEKKTDGELFYFIRNGVRNTAMPAWQLPDLQTWQLVLFLRNLPQTAAMNVTTPAGAADYTMSAQYAGSIACRKCHVEIYERWTKTLMANVVRDPREHPDAIISDFSKPNPLVTFSSNDVAFVYGSKWKQRYFKQAGNDYFPFPAQWDITHKQWRTYFAKDDWWAVQYPPDNFKRPTSATCDGCHSVNFNVSTHTVTEWNVGCEKCHGPGSEHVKSPASTNIINPSRMDYVQANDVCIQCHSQGRPLNNPLAGLYYDWPVGFRVGLKLSDYWKLEEHKLGETTFTHFADGTAHKNRMQGNDFVTSLMYTHGVACFTCHDSHGTAHNALLRKPASTLCLDCHGPNSPNGPHTPTIAQHTHHKAGSAGNECIACHMPRIAQTIADINVRSHTFRFVGPAQTDALEIPNACNVCHKDKTTAWTMAALKTWTERSPWRIAE